MKPNAYSTYTDDALIGVFDWWLKDPEIQHGFLGKELAEEFDRRAKHITICRHSWRWTGQYTEDYPDRHSKQIQVYFCEKCNERREV